MLHFPLARAFTKPNIREIKSLTQRLMRKRRIRMPRRSEQIQKSKVTNWYLPPRSVKLYLGMSETRGTISKDEITANGL